MLYHFCWLRFLPVGPCERASKQALVCWNPAFEPKLIYTCRICNLNESTLWIFLAKGIGPWLELNAESIKHKKKRPLLLSSFSDKQTCSRKDLMAELSLPLFNEILLVPSCGFWSFFPLIFPGHLSDIWLSDLKPEYNEHCFIQKKQDRSVYIKCSACMLTIIACLNSPTI